jgi:acyl-coenzyme A thioesterase PaaI-like protein
MMSDREACYGGKRVSHNQAKSQDPGVLGQSCHPSCLVCGERNRTGMGLRFEQQPDGTVVGHFACDPDYQGYPNRLHGGVVSMLLDAAMTHCLFARGIQAVTAKLNVRFRNPVTLGTPATIRARLVNQRAPLYALEAELTQHGKTCAFADARFFSEQS